MRPSVLLLGAVAASALAHPGMERALAEIQARDDTTLEGRSVSLLGDLVGRADTASGRAISAILTGASAMADGSTYTPPGGLGSPACKKDTCCVWSYISQELQGLFQDSTGCTDPARASIRLGFHDAATWDLQSSYGGADGSILLSDELDRPDNRGLSEVGGLIKSIFDKYKTNGIGMADLIQVAATVATVSCPGGPRIRTYVGRVDDGRAGPTGKLPSPFQDAQSLIDLFRAKTFTAGDLVALVGAHTASRQRFVDPARAGASQDATPGRFDNEFYSDTLKGDNTTILIFPSDKNLATYGKTQAQWKVFAAPQAQNVWAPVSFFPFVFFFLSTSHCSSSSPPRSLLLSTFVTLFSVDMEGYLLMERALHRRTPRPISA